MTRLDDYGFTNHDDHREKKFSITKAPPDPEMLALFEARRNALAEPRRRMDRAKYMFAEILDRATNTRAPGFIRKGSVAIPDSELARKFGVWESTIYTWKRQLEACGYVWTSKQYRSDRWPMTVYHVTALHPRPNFETQNPDGTSNATGGRPAPTNGNGARKPGQKSLPLAQPHVPPVPWNARRKVKNPQIVAAIAQFDRLPATASNGCEPQSAMADSHNGHGLTATAERGPQPQPTLAESHSSNGSPATVSRGHKRVSDRSLRAFKSKGEGEHPPDLEFAEWKSGLKGLFPSRLNAMRAELQAKLGIERDPQRRTFYKARIESIDEVRLGGKPPKPQTKPEPKPKALDEEPLTVADRNRLRDSFKALKESLKR